MAGKGTRKDFVEWLRSKKPGSPVGLRDGCIDPDDCLEFIKPGEMHSWCPLGAYAYIRLIGEWHNPLWVTDFVKAVDESGPAGTRITARKCLQLLGEDV